MGSGLLSTLALSLVILAVPALAGVDDWHFSWPSSTYQCQQVTVTITGGVAPWRLTLVPINQQPIYWTFTAPPSPVNASNPATATIPLQIQGGTPYVVMVADADGYNTALSNPTGIQIVGTSSDSSCFAAASPAKKDFDFQVYGNAAACERTFQVAWTKDVGVGPYGCTVVPLDSGWNPWDVELAGAGSIAANALWRVNMTSGSRFTVIMHDGYGEGRGGVGGIYEVQTAQNSSCVTQQYNGRSEWPAGLGIASIPATTSAWAALPSQTNSATGTTDQVASLSPTISGTASSSPTPASPGSSIGTGAIAGIAIGAAAVIIAIVALLFWYLRRKRNESRPAPGGDVDLLGGGGGQHANIEPKLTPYQAVEGAAPVPTMGYGTAQMVQREDGWASRGIDTPGTSASAAPFFGPAAPAFLGDRPTSQYSSSKGGYPSGVPLPTETTSPLSPPVEATNSYFNPLPAASSFEASSSDTKVGHSGYGTAIASPAAGHPLPPIPSGPSPVRSPSPEFRRHADGGEISPDAQQPRREVVDLPPLYTDVPSRANQQSH